MDLLSPGFQGQACSGHNVAFFAVTRSCPAGASAHLQTRISPYLFRKVRAKRRPIKDALSICKLAFESAMRCTCAVKGALFFAALRHWANPNSLKKGPHVKIFLRADG
jgi:hypothetical protein